MLENENFNEAENPQLNIGAVRRSYTYEEAKKIYIEGLGVAKAVFYGSLDKAEKFEEMLKRMNLLYDK